MREEKERDLEEIGKVGDDTELHLIEIVEEQVEGGQQALLRQPRWDHHDELPRRQRKQNAEE